MDSCCEHGTELSGSVRRGELPDHLTNYRLGIQVFWDVMLHHWVSGSECFRGF